MIGIIIASHGDFANGILQSAFMIGGDQSNIMAVALDPSMGPEEFKESLKDAIKEIKTKEILFLVDLWGGTPYHQANLLCEKNKGYELVAGVNLPVLLEALSVRESMSLKSLVTHLMEVFNTSIYASVKPSLKKEKQIIKSSGEGIAFSGKINIAFARVDSRLVHGQVVTSWVQNVKPNRIIVVSDRVAYDQLRKKLLEQTAPPGIKVNVIPISKMISISDDVRFGNTKALVLFETIQDALKTIQGGVDIKELNIGSMAHREGKVAVNKVLSLDEEDVKAFTVLESMNVKFDVRKVPSDAPENMNAYIRRAVIMLQDGKGE